jgi:Undecaprenyl-phosphate glucose phosphotransferase
MIKRRSQTLAAWICLCDVVTVGAAWIGAYYLRFSGLFPVEKEQPPFEWCRDALTLVVPVSALAFWLTSNYEIHRLRRMREELWAVSKGVPLLILMVTGGSFFLKDPYVSRGAMVIFALLSLVSVFIMRRLTWWAVHYVRRRGYNPSFSVIVGTGRTARKTSVALRSATWMGFRNVGYVEDSPTRWSSDLDILGTVADLPSLIERYKIDHVFICLPMNRFNEARRVFDVLSESTVDVRLVADFPNLAGVSLTTTFFEGMPIVGLRESPHFGVNIVIKRVMDIVLASVALLLLSPVMIVIALLVKFTSKGPIFFRQERCGLNGQSFQMLKFRSLKLDAEAATGPVWASKNDDRRTRIGGFLRKTSLDELPQFINVLKGNMSIVGPRPERPVFIDQFRKTIPNYMVRHAVKCGITGWAQVNGWRGNTSLRKRIQYDLHYIIHWTPWLDLKIMWLTVWHGLVHRNAY